MLTVRQRFPERAHVDLSQSLATAIAAISSDQLSGKRIAVGVGSRGITGLCEIVKTVISELKSKGANPFVFPAMGSHGGATPDGQLEVLESYGITEKQINAPIDANMDVAEMGNTASGIAVACSQSALNADGILLINRIKPHTDFFGSIGSGLMKMSVVGLGKQIGASRFHLAAAEIGYEKAIFEIATHLIENTSILGGIAILEDEHHSPTHMQWVPKHQITQQEPTLHQRAKEMMPSLPFDTLDLLIIDRIGKNISGAGMDPNITQRSIHGHSTLLIPPDERRPFVRRIFVRDLTPESHGNAVGIGMADATTQRLVDATDWSKSITNAMTSMTPSSVKIPISFQSDQQAIIGMLNTLPLADKRQARIVRITSTLDVTTIMVSESLWSLNQAPDRFEVLSPAAPIEFDASGNLKPICS